MICWLYYVDFIPIPLVSTVSRCGSGTLWYVYREELVWQIFPAWITFIWREITYCAVNIAVTSYNCHGFSNHREFDSLFNSLPCYQQESINLSFVRGIHQLKHPHAQLCLYNEINITWWRHQMETFSALLAICVGNSPASGKNSPHKGQWRGALMFSLICV